MKQSPSSDQKALWNDHLRRWNDWQERVGSSPAEFSDLALQQVLDFRMSHRLASVEAIHWMAKQLAEKGLGSIHAQRLPEHEPKGDHHVAVFRTGTGSHGILEGHHRLVAACLMAYRQGGTLWQSLIRIRVHSPDSEAIRLWQVTVPEMDRQMLARFPVVEGASATIGTIREFVADGQWAPEGWALTGKECLP